MVDLPGVPSNEDERLRQLLREFLQAKEEEIEEDDWKTELSDGVVSVLTGREDDRPMYQVKEEVDLSSRPLVVGEFPGEEGDRLLDYIAEEYGEDLPTACLRRLEIDAFGRNGENLHDWERKLPDIENKLLADIHGLSRQREIHLMQGVVCQDDDIAFNDDIRLIHPEQDEIYARSQLRGATGLPPQIDADSLLEIRTTKRREDRSVKERSIRQLRLALATLRIYGATPVETVLTHQFPVTYMPSGTEYLSRKDSTLPPTYAVSPADRQSLQNLFRLLEDFYDEPQGFTPPINIAIEHFEASLTERTKHHSSITFAVIGLESLYKHYTDGTGSSTEIQRYAGFTLGQTVPHLDPLTVKRHLETAYSTRDNLVHGDSIPGPESETLQHRIWDYLRYSIVIFALLGEPADDEFQLAVEEAFLDDEQRDDFTDELAEISIMNYLKVQTD